MTSIPTRSARPKVLICTILRDQLSNLDTWLDQLIKLIYGQMGSGYTNLYNGISTDYDVEVSCYENDSIDNTGPNAKLRLEVHLWLKYGIKIYFRSEKLGTQKYGSIWNVHRIKNLAAARQACLDQVEGGLDRFDKICYIEPDVTYDPFWLRELILARHPKAAGIGDPDVYSGWSLRSLSNPKESTFLYDTCATRATRDDICWDINEYGGTWRGDSLVRTDLGGHDANCLHRVWSTFNCFCVYNARPFKEGVRWGITNKSVNPSGIQIGVDENGSIHYLEADTVNICEQFRQRGYNGIFLNTNCLVRHN